MPDWVLPTIGGVGIVLLSVASLMLLYSGLIRPIRAATSVQNGAGEADLFQEFKDWMKKLLDLHATRESLRTLQIQATLSDTLGAAAVAGVVAATIWPIWLLGASLFGVGAGFLVGVRAAHAWYTDGSSIRQVILAEIKPNAPASVVVALAVGGAVLWKFFGWF